MPRRLLYLALMLLTICATGLLAQTRTSVRLTGSVEDSSGAVIANARVEAKLQCKCSECAPEEGCKCCPEQTTVSTTTDSSGQFAFSVVPGRYAVTVSVSGFATQTVETTVTPGASKHLNIRIAVGR